MGQPANGSDALQVTYESLSRSVYLHLEDINVINVVSTEKNDDACNRVVRKVSSRNGWKNNLFLLLRYLSSSCFSMFDLGVK